MIRAQSQPVTVEHPVTHGHRVILLSRCHGCFGVGVVVLGSDDMRLRSELTVPDRSYCESSFEFGYEMT